MTDLGPESRALLDAIHDAHDPDEADRARNRAALMRRIAAGAVVATTATAAAKAAAANTVAAKTTVAVTPTVAAAGGSAFFLKGVAILALLGAAGVSVPKLFSSPSPASQPATTAVQPVATAPAPVVAAEPVAPVVAEPAPVVAEPAPVAAEPAPKAVAIAPKPSVAKPVETQATPASIAADLGAIRDAHAALKAGDPARALALTDTISTSSPVAQERAVVRILAHCAMGSGQDVASRFLDAHPGSPAAARIRSACGLSTP